MKRQIALLLWSLFLFNSLVFPIFAEPLPTSLPTGYQTQSGNVNFNQNGNILNVNSSSNRSIVNYQSFNVGRDSSVNFNLPSSSSAILNRVLGGGVSEIFGKLNSNGHVFLVNLSGILFGKTASVNVQSLFASTLSISDSNFLSGNYVFESNGSFGSIVNDGSLSGNQSIDLFGAAIKNTSSINAPSINLAVGDKLVASLDGGIKVEVTVTDELKNKVNGFNDAISNSGNINGNYVNLKTNLEDGLYDFAVNNSGLLKANNLLDILGQTQNTTQVPEKITETVVNDNGTPNDPSDDFNEQIEKEVLVDKIITSNGGNIINHNPTSNPDAGMFGASMKIQAGTLENGIDSVIESDQGDIDIKLSSSKSALMKGLDGILYHGGWYPNRRVYSYRYEECSLFSCPSSGTIVRRNGKFYVKIPVYEEEVTYAFLNKGSIESWNDLNISAEKGAIINRSGKAWDASLTGWNDVNLTGPEVLNQRGGFYTTYRKRQLSWDNDHYREYWTDREPETNAFIFSGNDLDLKTNKFTNYAGKITSMNNLNFNTAPDAPTDGNFTNVSKILQQTKHEHWIRKRFPSQEDHRDLWWKYSIDSPAADIYVEYDMNLGTSTNLMKNFGNTGLIDVGNFTAFGSGNFINGITDRNIQNPSNFIPGTIQTNRFLLNAELMDFPLGYFLNTGYIEGKEEVKIKAQKIENKKRTALAYTNVRTNKGLFSPSRFEQVVYDSIQSGGQIQGGEIILSAEDEFINRGGIIKAEKLASLYPSPEGLNNGLPSQKGLLQITAPKITNTVTEGNEVITWEVGNLGKLLGVKNWGYKPVFQEGILSSNGELRLSGETILNQGSDITAKGDININADKLVEQNWVAKTYTSG